MSEGLGFSELIGKEIKEIKENEVASSVLWWSQPNAVLYMVYIPGSIERLRLIFHFSHPWRSERAGIRHRIVIVT